MKITVPNHIVITWSRLRKTMKKFREHVIPDSDVHKIVAAIRAAYITDKKARKNHAMSVQEISNELDFPSQSVFGKYFKRVEGMSPKAYRQSLSKD